MTTEELDFVVKPKNLPEFIKILVDYEIDNEIIGQNDDNYPIIHIEYEQDHEEAIMQLMEVAKVVKTEDEELEED